LLVQAGPKGVPAGEIAAETWDCAQHLSFHFDRLRHAGLVSFERRGRSLIHAARHDTMNPLINYLTKNYCPGRPELCKPGSRGRGKKERKASKEG
jgi:hypothetical protein